jgi:hypothetical protein
LMRGVIVRFVDIGDIVDHHHVDFPIKAWSEKQKTNIDGYITISVNLEI